MYTQMYDWKGFGERSNYVCKLLPINVCIDLLLSFGVKHHHWATLSSISVIVINEEAYYNNIFTVILFYGIWPVFRSALHSGDADLYCSGKSNMLHVVDRLCCGIDIPWLGHELPCHLVVWHSGRRRITTIPQRWPTNMTSDKLLNREYTYFCNVDKCIETSEFRNLFRIWCTFLPFNREEFCEIFRAKDRNTLKMYTCKKFHKKDGRKVRKAAKNEIMILKM